MKGRVDSVPSKIILSSRSVLADMNINEYNLAIRVRGTQVKDCVENFPKNLIRRVAPRRPGKRWQRNEEQRDYIN